MEKTDTILTVQLMATECMPLHTKYPYCAIINGGVAGICFTEYLLTRSRDSDRVALRLFEDADYTKQVAVFVGVGDKVRLVNELGDEFSHICEED